MSGNIVINWDLITPTTKIYDGETLKVTVLAGENRFFKVEEVTP